VCRHRRHCWIAVRAACSSIAGLPLVSSPCITRLFFAYHPATAVDWSYPAQCRLRIQPASHHTTNRRLPRLIRSTWRLTRRIKWESTCASLGFTLLWGCSNVSGHSVNAGDVGETPRCTASPRRFVFHRIASHDTDCLAVSYNTGSRGPICSPGKKHPSRTYPYDKLSSFC